MGKLDGKDFKNREETGEKAIKIIKECVKNHISFVLYTSGEADIISSSRKNLIPIVGSLLMNLIQLNNKNKDYGLSKSELVAILNKAEDFANDDEDSTQEQEGKEEIDEALKEFKDTLKNVIDKINKM